MTFQKFLQHDAVNDLPYEDKKMSDAVALEVGTIGENMRLRRAIFLPKLEGQFLNSYVHNSGENKSCTNFLLCKYIIFIFIIYIIFIFL